MSVIIAYENKLDSRSAYPILFITRNDYRPNWTPLSSITITYHYIIIIIIITIIFIVITIYFVSILTFLLRFVKGFSLILQDFCIVYIVMNTFVTEMLQPDNFVALKCKFYSQLCM